MDNRKPVIMQRDDPLTQIRIRAHLYGRSQAGRVMTAVLEALRPYVPPSTFRELVTQLPTGLAATPADAAPGRCADFVADVARRLHVGTTDAVFYARVTFEHLNAYCRGVTPAGLAAELPDDMRSLLTARADDPSLRPRLLLRTFGSAVTALSLAAPVAREQPAALKPVPRLSV
ncbi:DUF2267 domain-containing protein [Actinoplanes sp. NPDC049265]|uniref:DUF2267 domain-containing protein n=1 Tax=Actinoplanes sp. NPDC049265 TaxID=3363902 RepID=UPI00371AC552